MKEKVFCLKSFFYLSFFLFAVVFCSGCASLGTYNPATGRNEIVLISTQEEVAMGNSVHEQIQEKFQFSSNESLLKGIRNIGFRLAQVSDRKDYTYRFFLINSKEINAFTTPGGNIYVFTGLLSKLKSDDELAAVLAHEMGHCAAKHIAKKYQVALGYGLVGSIALGYLGNYYPSAKNIASFSSNAIMDIIFKAFSRKDEYEADRLGLKYLNLAGFNVDGIIGAFEMLQRESQGSKLPAFLRTHPHIEDRIKLLKEQIAIIKQNSV